MVLVTDTAPTPTVPTVPDVLALMELGAGLLWTIPEQLAALSDEQLEGLLAYERGHQDRFVLVESVTFRLWERTQR